MGKTAIEWATDVWNPVTGCTKMSQGCKHCYAERFAKRLGYDFSQVELHWERLIIPFQWKRPKRIFVNSMSDLFHEKVPDFYIQQVFSTMIQSRQHIFQILSKRPRRMFEFCKRQEELGMTPLENVWLGVSVEDQATADERIPLLLQTPAAVRFVSCEPLLGPLTLPSPLQGEGKLDWVIVGGESGPGARPMHPDWARSLRDQCLVTWTAFFMKQMGGFPNKRGKLEDIPEDLRYRGYPEEPD